MNTETPTRELRDEELDCVSGGIDIGSAMHTVLSVTEGAIIAGIKALTSGSLGGVPNKDRRPY
jgi:hypothetical protein